MADLSSTLAENPALADVLRQCRTSTRALAKVFFPEAVFRPFSTKLHDPIFTLIDNAKEQKVAIIAPRGIGKTTLVTALIARYVLFGLKKNIVYISSSQTMAIEKTENIKDALLANDTLRKLFGDIRSDSFSKECWATSTGVRVIPRGAGQAIRGTNYRFSRPDIIILDDVEDEESVMSEDRRSKLWTWFNGAVLNSIDRGSRDWKIVVIGSLLHEASLMAKVQEPKSGFTTLSLSICDEAYESNWPEFITTDEIRALGQEFRDRGEADVFAREYRGVPISHENASFRSSYFHYYTEEQLFQSKKRLETLILVDPAKTATASSDYSAITAVGLDQDSASIYVRDLLMARLYPDQLYEQVAQFLIKFHTHVLGIEVTGLNEFILQPLKSFLHKRGLPFELVELRPRGGEHKSERIGALIPYYRQGQVFHNASGCCQPLEDQLLSYPRSKHDDAMDCLSYIVEMLELGGRYFNPVDPTPEELAREYAELDSEVSDEPALMWSGLV